ncbi:unnamed protein product [Rhizoctonia solani]|uniref:Uncharacterized protein n=1 Tax=Rhizoctonia solani TaxID=456999 RepID=A0A8H3BZC6_9AGAM|nr:unnamed protein product [Rhizoctonia solani]
MSAAVTLEGLNTPPGAPISITADYSITVSALPGTDLWRKPPATSSVNAPAYVVYRPLKQFKRARVTERTTAATPSGGYADLSLVPIDGKSATIEVLAQKPSLKVYLIRGDKKIMIRQVTWVFQDKQDLLLGVGVFAARPAKMEGKETEKGEALTVLFEGLEMEWSD